MQNIKVFSFCNFFIALWIIYNLQALFFGVQGTLYSRLILLFLLVVSFYYFAYTLFHYRIPQYLKGLTLLLLVLIAYGLIYMLGSVGKVRQAYLQSILISLLPIFPFYVFTRQGKLNLKTLRWWIIVFVIATTVEFFQVQQRTIQVKMMDEDAEMVNNVGYIFLSIMPLLAFYSRKKIIMYAGLVYLAVFILLAMKRGALLIGVVIVLWMIYSTLKESKGIRKIGTFLLTLFLFFLLVSFARELLSTSDLFNARIENTMEGDSSGRDYIYSTLWNHFLYDSTILQQLFGNGAEATVRIAHIHAHNDWLELMINQGLLGIIVYLVYWYRFFNTCKSSKFDDELFLAMSTLFIIYFLKTLFSMSYSNVSIYSAICLGYCLGLISNSEKKSYIQTEDS